MVIIHGNVMRGIRGWYVMDGAEIVSSHGTHAEAQAALTAYLVLVAKGKKGKQHE